MICVSCDRVQCDKDVEIKEKLKQIIIEKSRLKMLGQNGFTPQVAQESVKMPQVAKKEVANKVIPKPTPSIPKATPGNQVQPKVGNEKTLKNKDKIFGTPIETIEKHSKVVNTEPIEIKTRSSQEIPVQVKADDVEVMAVVSRFYSQSN